MEKFLGIDIEEFRRRKRALLATLPEENQLSHLRKITSSFEGHSWEFIYHLVEYFPEQLQEMIDSYIDKGESSENFLNQAKEYCFFRSVLGDLEGQFSE